MKRLLIVGAGGFGREMFAAAREALGYGEDFIVAGFLDDNKELQISCPSLILVGERDNTGKVKQYNKAWSKRTGIKIIWIPNAAHNSNVDNPEFVNSCIEEFLADL